MANVKRNEWISYNMIYTKERDDMLERRRHDEPHRER